MVLFVVLLSCSPPYRRFWGTKERPNESAEEQENVESFALRSLVQTELNK